MKCEISLVSLEIMMQKKTYTITLLFLLVLFSTGCLRSAKQQGLLPSLSQWLKTQTNKNLPENTNQQESTIEREDITPTPGDGQVTEENPSLPSDAPSIFDHLPSLYLLQPGNPVPLKNYLYPDKGCQWSGIGGQVFGIDGLPAIGLTVEISGTVKEERIHQVVLTGGEPKIGTGGYIIKLADQAIGSQDNLKLYVKELTGKQVSPQILVDTYADCEKNFLLVNFLEVNPTHVFFLPFVQSNK